MTDEAKLERHGRGMPRRVLDAESIVYLIAVVAFLCAYLFLVFFPEAIEYQRIGTVKHAGIGYSGHAPGPVLPEATQFLERRLSDARDLRISFNVRVTGTSAFDNLFQTAPGNQGVRMELGQPSVLALVVGSREAGGLSGFIVSRNVEQGRWHSVRLSISADKQIRAFFDGKLAVDVRDPKIDYAITDIAVGTGFSKTRPFSGELTNFSVEYRLLQGRPALASAVPLLLVLLSATLTVLLVLAGFRDARLSLFCFAVLSGLCGLTALYPHRFLLESVAAGSSNNFLVWMPPLLRPLQALFGAALLVLLPGAVRNAAQRLGETAMAGPQKAGLIASVVLTGFACSVSYHYIAAAYFQAGFPYNTFLFHAFDRFNDFFNMYRVVGGLNPYLSGATIPSNYYPFANVVFLAFTLLPESISLICYYALFTVFFVCWNIRNVPVQERYSRWMTIFALSFLTYPFLFVLDRGNIEGLVFIFLCLFVTLHASGKHRAAALALIPAIAMKVYPAVFLILFISDRRYRETAAVVLGSILLSFGILLLFKGGFFANLAFIMSGFNVSHAVGFTSDNYILQGLSLFFIAKLLLFEIGLTNVATTGSFLHAYTAVVFVVFLLTGWYIVKIERDTWRKVALLVLVMLLFPHVSFDYKLLHLFIPLFLFINAEHRSDDDAFYALVFALLLVPKAYFTLFPDIRTNYSTGVSISVLVNPLLMLLMGYAIVRDGLRMHSGNAASSVQRP